MKRHEGRYPDWLRCAMRKAGVRITASRPETCTADRQAIRHALINAELAAARSKLQAILLLRRARR